MNIKAMAPVMIIVFLSQVANAAIYGQSWLYAIGVVFQLVVAFMSFVSLLLDLWRDEDEAT